MFTVHKAELCFITGLLMLQDN